MIENFRQALIAGVERLTAWADLLDRINVFPIADGDTGRNLVISLAPLRRPDRDVRSLSHDLLISARGNSGNIASRFFQCFIQSTSWETMPDAVRLGRDRAWHAVPDPRPGTMLSFLDALAAVLHDAYTIPNTDRICEILTHLESIVLNTTEQQLKLREAKVVDAGALGMFLYFEGFFYILTNGRIPFRTIMDTFRGRLQVLPSFLERPEAGYCVDMVLQSEKEVKDAGQTLASIGESVVVTQEDSYLKVHFHTQNKEEARRRLDGLGQLIGWVEDDLYLQTSSFGSVRPESGIHIMTDAAGSLTREEAKTLGITLMDSYITIGDRCMPETYFRHEELYRAMRTGVHVSTAQASVFERYQIYESVLSLHSQVLYLCVGSAFTGNYGIVMEWKRRNDPEERLAVIDTGAASGRLGVLTLAVANYAVEAGHYGQVIAFARKAAARCEEYVFLDRLEYLAAGGRLSKAGAFFGDMLHMKPVVSPMPEGARKMGVVRNREEQLRFAIEAMGRSLQPEVNALVMLEYSDNRPWMEEIKNEVVKRYPKARIIIHPLSLTSGAHMGPGTWAVAFLPDIR
ncbi:MAG TPA: DegV family protein [Syntrophales bacterium]|nr:DegV family protein [Syntrophales bacterium]